MMARILLIITLAAFQFSRTLADGATIQVNAQQILQPVSPYLTGACLEDVNHEVYGGIFSQMIFGESFQEPQTQIPLANFADYGGSWQPQNGDLFAAAGAGPKLVYTPVVVTNGEASVEVLFPSKMGGNAGFIVRVTDPAVGADAFSGYEITLAPAGYLVLGRHRQNWEPISQPSCAVPMNQWITLRVTMLGNQIGVFVNGSNVVQYTDTQFPLLAGNIGLRPWQQDARFRNFSITTNGVAQTVPFELATNAWGAGVSSMWAPLRSGTATGTFALETTNVFVGTQCQRINFTNGVGEVGIANQGLNRWGMYFAGGQQYEGWLWARAASPTLIYVALENSDGSMVLVEQSLQITSNDWQRLAFNLTPATTNSNGRFSIKLKQPGSATIGYAFLQPGDWGRFQGLPVRRDVAEGLVNQGINVLRYGGSMVNASGYRWKKMVGLRDQRPPYTGTWYAYSSNGWGIFDFLNFCEAADILGIPDLNINESSQDLADFVDYVNGATNTVWGAQRAADGHPQPYGLKYVELGNEERVDSAYYQKFQALATNIWAKDTNIILVVGDFGYHQNISDPFSFSGADSGITTLAAHQQILQLTKQYNREVWFDVHVWTDGPTPDSSLAGMFSYYDALDQIADGTRHKVVVFELNANNHSQRRAVANAIALNTIQRDGRLPIVASANCLQPDGQNDNGWDQGLLFLNPPSVWLQPPGYVTRMIANHRQALAVQSGIDVPGTSLDVSAERSDDGKTLVVSVANSGSIAVPTTIDLGTFVPDSPVAIVEQLAASLDAVNTATNPTQVVPQVSNWNHNYTNGSVQFSFPAYAFTILQFQGNLTSAPPAVLTHRWSFAGTSNATLFVDSVPGITNGWLHGAAHLDGNGCLVLPGLNQKTNYAELSSYLLNTNYSAVTFEFWVSFGTNPTWGRLLDFGDTSPSGNGRYYISFTPHSGFSPNGVNFETTGSDPGYSAIQNVATIPVLDNLGKLHLVLVWDTQAQYLAIYTNGILLARNNQVTLPMAAIDNAHSYLGKSSYATDNCGVAVIDEFRMYNGAMGEMQIAANLAAGPGVFLDPTLSIAQTDTGLLISWPEFLPGSLQSSTNLGSNASWTTPPPGATAPILSNGMYRVTLSMNASQTFFRLAQ